MQHFAVSQWTTVINCQSNSWILSAHCQPKVGDKLAISACAAKAGRSAFWSWRTDKGVRSPRSSHSIWMNKAHGWQDHRIHCLRSFKMLSNILSDQGAECGVDHIRSLLTTSLIAAPRPERMCRDTWWTRWYSSGIEKFLQPISEVKPCAY